MDRIHQAQNKKPACYEYGGVMKSGADYLESIFAPPYLCKYWMIKSLTQMQIAINRDLLKGG